MLCFLLEGKVLSPSGTYETTGIIPSKQRVERKERSRLKKVLFSGKKDGQPGDGEYMGRQLLMFHKWRIYETTTNQAHIYAIFWAYQGAILRWLVFICSRLNSVNTVQH